MAKLGRVLQKIFGQNATSGGVGVGQMSQIGSTAAGTPTAEPANDVGALAMQGLSNYLSGWFSCILGGNSPVMEDMNSLHYLITRQLAYLFQEGVPEYDATTTYYKGSVVQDGLGNVYVSRQDSNVGNAVNTTNNWKLLPCGKSLNPQVTSATSLRAASNNTQGTMPETNHYEDICWSPELGLFCAVSYDGTHQVMTSPDGKTFTGRTASSSAIWTSVCWSPELGLFCAVNGGGAGSFSMTSPDGITWTGYGATTSNWNSVCWSPALGLFVAVANASGGSYVATSPDGATWTGRTAAELNQWNGVTWAPELNLFVAVASSGVHRVMTSPDGITWTARTAPAQDWNGICWSPDLGVFVATENFGIGVAMYSYDGINWTQVSLPSGGSTYERLCWCPELGIFVVTSQDAANRLAISYDGINWTGVAAPTAQYVSVAWSPKLGIFVAVTIDATGHFSYSKYVKKFVSA